MFETINAEGAADIVVICDHASCLVPANLGNLGLDPALLRGHIGWDIGAADVARGLARRLDATAVLAGFSRLVIDPNRAPGHPHSIRAESDGVPIPGNRDIGRAEAEWRARAWYHPYHQEIERQLARLQGRAAPLLISVHSFTPVMNGVARPWHAALLHGDDARSVAPLMAAFGARYPDLAVGDNEPYTGYPDQSHTVPHHAERRGIPNVTFEIRQDLIDGPRGVERWVDILCDVLAGARAAPGNWISLPNRAT
jgi:predicted N-formylglutamate amidohydrolase